MSRDLNVVYICFFVTRQIDVLQWNAVGFVGMVLHHIDMPYFHTSIRPTIILVVWTLFLGFGALYTFLSCVPLVHITKNTYFSLPIIITLSIFYLNITFLPIFIPRSICPCGFLLNPSQTNIHLAIFKNCFLCSCIISITFYFFYFFLQYMCLCCAPFFACIFPLLQFFLF